MVCRFFDDGHSDWCEVVPHCGFDLHFSDTKQCSAPFHWPPVSSLEKGLLRPSACPLIGLLAFLILSCKCCFHILEINLLSVALFANIFSHSEGCLVLLWFL